MHPATTFILLRAATFLLAASSIACREPATTPGTALQPATSASDFSVYSLGSEWTNQQGRTARLSALSGKVRVVAMVYTNCHSTCPLIVAEMKRIEAAIPEAQRGNAGFVLVSLDPVRDTPARLAEWASSIELDPATWTILTGNESAVRELAATFEVRYQTQQNNELAHTNGLTVLDRQGHVVHQQVRLGESAETIRIVNSQLQ